MKSFQGGETDNYQIFYELLAVTSYNCYTYSSPQVADRLVDPFLRGIIAGDLRTTSIKAMFPRLKTVEELHGSIVRNFRKVPEQATGMLSVEYVRHTPLPITHLTPSVRLALTFSFTKNLETLAGKMNVERSMITERILAFVDRLNLKWSRTSP